jgi:hypothetical protein
MLTSEPHPAGEIMSRSAECAIRSLASTYAQATVTRDADAWAGTWAENGIWELMGQVPEGRDAVLAYWKQVMANIQFVFQLPGEGSIELDESAGRGTGRFPTVEFVKMGDGPGTLMLGTYHDVYVIESGEWRFAERRMKISYMGPPDLSAAPTPG